MGVFDDEPLILSALNVCCKPNWSADSPALAASTNIRHYFRVLYDEITFGDPNGTLPGHILVALLKVLGLPCPKVIPEICSLTDFERILTGQFCARQNVSPRVAKSITTEQVCAWLRQKSGRDLLQLGLSPPNLESSIASSPGGLQGLEDSEKVIDQLLRLVSAQRAEIETMNVFIEDLSVAIQYLDAKNVASKLNFLRETYACAGKKHKTEQRQNLHLISKNQHLQQKISTISVELERLKGNLQEIKEKIDQGNRAIKEERIMSRSWTEKPLNCLASVDKSLADDSGWISDDEMPMSDAMTSSQSSAAVTSPNLILETCGTSTFGLIGIPGKAIPDTSQVLKVNERVQSPGGIKFTDRLLLPNPWSTLQIKAKLATLSEKLNEAELKLNHVLKRRREILV